MNVFNVPSVHTTMRPVHQAHPYQTVHVTKAKLESLVSTVETAVETSLSAMDASVPTWEALLSGSVFMPFVPNARLIN